MFLILSNQFWPLKCIFSGHFFSDQAKHFLHPEKFSCIFLISEENFLEVRNLVKIFYLVRNLWFPTIAAVTKLIQNDQIPILFKISKIIPISVQMPILFWNAQRTCFRLSKLLVSLTILRTLCGYQKYFASLENFLVIMLRKL